MSPQAANLDRADAIIRSHVFPEGQEGWQNIPELPLASEITEQVRSLPLEHYLKGARLSKDAYLEAQYRILRHEGIEPLRKAVQEYKAAPEMVESNETLIYTEVFVSGINIIRLGIMVRVTFSATRARSLVNWSASQRLVPGTVVALSPVSDNFEATCVVGVVAGRYDETIPNTITPPPIDLEICNSQLVSGLMEPDQEYVMIEARSNYYEAVRHVMEGLKQAAQARSPLDKYLFQGVIKVGCAAFLPCSYRSLDISALHPGNASNSVPLRVPSRGESIEHIQSQAKLDKWQMLALRRMVTKELAMVQGPPGTGKTHTSMAALRVLLSVHPNDIPIIITAQKNDTVDELLMSLRKLDISFIRLGGQAKSAAISARNLYNLRTSSRDKTWKRDRFQQQLDGMKSQVKLLVNRCFPPFQQQLLMPRHLLDVGLITAAQCDSIMGAWEGTLDKIGGEIRRHPLGPWLGDHFLVKKLHRSIHVPVGHDDVDDENSLNHNDLRPVVGRKKEQLTGKLIPVTRWAVMVMPAEAGQDWETKAKQLLLQHQNLWEIPARFRGMTYRYLEQRYSASTKLALGTIFRQINDAVKELKMIRWQEDLDTVRKSGARVIGCTTTGLTKYRGLIAAMQPRVMMIEEAAETREANIMAALFPSLKQMILVGDHMQLAPHADVLELGRPPYNLNVSLFQRLIEGGLEFSSLQIQRRMAPDIRGLLNAWYPSLADHECTHGQDFVPGMGSQRLLWFDHKHPESANRYSSKVNAFEAEMIVGLYKHLVCQGTKPSEITLLAFYSGQRAYIEGILRRNHTCAPVPDRDNGDSDGFSGPEVQTIDGYQGKENEVVLISVTRSPDDRRKPDAGFLKDLRRVIVALSRSRRLLVIFGNAQNLIQSSGQAIWSEVLGRMGSVRFAFVPLFCGTHKREIRIAIPDDWERLASHGGCGMRCGQQMSAHGPVCERKCHG
ncbi:dead box helicase [Colletotrichum musicola]|uniref:Dead box helicase n=1 Tax=Colletotrichum musicola TaxID=2175873 RepID=A0A8H6KGE3_9PEZI|nr:dead box helicase [Colletotrichum musicola]